MLSQRFTKLLIVCVNVYAYRGAHAKVHLQTSDNSQQLVLSFYHMSSRDRTQVTRLGRKHNKQTDNKTTTEPPLWPLSGRFLLL